MSGRAATLTLIRGDFALSVGDSGMPCPKGWAWVALTNVAQLESGHTPSRQKPRYWDGGIPWIGIRDAREHHGGVIHETLQTVTQAGLDNSAARLLPANTVCLSRTASVGYVVIMGKSMATSQDFVNWVCGPGVDPFFLQKLLIAENASLFRFGKGSTHTTIYYPEVKAFHACLPPIKEQRRIVAKLDKLQVRSQRATAALDEVTPLLEQLRRSILAAAFRGDLTADWRAKHPDVEPASALLARIRTERRTRWEAAELAKLVAKGKTPTDDRWKTRYMEPKPADDMHLPKLPRGWCWANWSEVGFSQNGRAFPSAEYGTVGVKLLRPGNLHVGGALEWIAANTQHMPLAWSTEYPDYVVSSGQLLMNLTAQSLKDEFLGRVCLSGRDEVCLLNQRIARLTPVALPVEYWLWYFKSPRFRAFVDTLNTGSLIQHMFTSHLDACVVPLMPADEARQLVGNVVSQMRRVVSLQALAGSQSARFRQLDRATLAKAFRGELVPQDPTDEPAADMLARLRGEQGATAAAQLGAKAKRARKG